jgi:hypothetical protein
VRLPWLSTELQGSGAVDNQGNLTFFHQAASDALTEGNETLNFKLFSDSNRTTQVGTTANIILINNDYGNNSNFYIVADSLYSSLFTESFRDTDVYKNNIINQTFPKTIKLNLEN